MLPISQQQRMTGRLIVNMGDWLKAMGGRTRSPLRRKYEREEVGVKMDRGKERSGQVSHDVVTGEGGDIVHHYSNPKSFMEEGAGSGQVQAPVAISL